jgi:phenylacetate-CoA ligase
MCDLRGRQIKRRRFGPGFYRALEWLKQTQQWSQQQLLQYQNQQLRWLIPYCYANVPYYRRIMDERGLSPDDFQTRDDLCKLPILTKQDVRQNGNEMISRDVDRRELISIWTSGTTGPSLKLWTVQEAIEFQWALWWRHRSWLGLNPTDRFATFSGNTIVPRWQKGPPYWRTVRSMNQLYFSVYHLSTKTIADYAAALDCFQPKYISGYPSAIYLFATLLERSGLRLKHRPQYVVTGAETQLHWQKEQIERIIAPCSEHYGLAEQCANLSKCEKGIFHEDMEYAILEHLPVDKNDPTGPVRMIQTGFVNRAMPFIRYDAGDVATNSPMPCECGRPSDTMISIDGRIDSFIVTREGRMVGRLANLFKGMVNIVEAQLVQEEIDSIRVRVVRGSEFSRADEVELVNRIGSRIGEGIDISFDYVERIERSATGKFRAVISRVGSEYLRQGKIGVAQNLGSIL